MKFASKGELLSLLLAKVSVRGTFKSTKGKMATISGRLQRAVPRTHPTPKPVGNVQRKRLFSVHRRQANGDLHRVWSESLVGGLHAMQGKIVQIYA
jgi:hypothetical protein